MARLILPAAIPTVARLKTGKSARMRRVTKGEAMGRLIGRRAMAFAAALLLALPLAVAGANAQPDQQAAPVFQTAAPFAILVDADTRTVLLERAADELMVPASLTKIMTAAVVFEEIKLGRLKLEDEFVISENAWRRGGAPSGGSAMFAAVKSRVKVADLLRGLIVQSGNDAAIALAEGISGNEAAFALKMTERARSLGLKKSTFRNATGFGDPAHRVTARELADLAFHVIGAYPDLYAIFGEREFTWNRIRQLNRNPLLAMNIGADGLKTGNIAEAGFGLVGSAVQGGQRLVMVINGLKTAQEREAEGRKMLEWAFHSFEMRQLFGQDEIIGQARVYGGERTTVAVTAGAPVRYLAPRGSTEPVEARIVYTGPLRTPVARGAEIGRIRIMRGRTVALERPVFAAEDMAAGPLTRRAADAALEQGRNLMRDLFRRGRPHE